MLPFEGGEFPVLIDGVRGSVSCELPARGLRGFFQKVFGF